ncbi:MAG: Uncharacterized protein conserved in bacteria, putative lipoprotein [uncultured Paraburkholderia sp.]|nr:MAG: Uncharacterized protein conserved in bacteria, putative lipoprotein [uncultured Paraburkholderia sp.]CAH2934874.1 MAG: Uncharacterized protein conserved in bacteria, putative lipoprotein [uncultured Paraburkholderia sp.]
MLASAQAYATSFYCNKGRSLTEKMICRDPVLSKLDDTLGQLYWKARRRFINRRAFLVDGNSKWAWHEVNCRDTACLGTWYATRIDELQQLIESMRTGATATPSSPTRQDDPDNARPAPSMPAPPPMALAALQCTAANPGIVINAQCPTVLGESGTESGTPWRAKPHSGDWFCGVAMLSPADMSATTQAEAAQ